MQWFKLPGEEAEFVDWTKLLFKLLFLSPDVSGAGVGILTGIKAVKLGGADAWVITGAGTVGRTGVAVTAWKRDNCNRVIWYWGAGSQISWVQRGKKLLICLEGKSMTPGRETLFSSVPSSNLLFLILKGFMSWHGALQQPSKGLVHCFWTYRKIRTLSGVPH